jgi:hypothetical protein
MRQTIIPYLAAAVLIGLSVWFAMAGPLHHTY